MTEASLTKNLENLRNTLYGCSNLEKRLKILSQQPGVQQFKKEFPEISVWLKTLTAEQQYLLEAVVAIGQADAVFEDFDPDKVTGLDAFIKILRDMDRFYDTIGGIIGYQLAIMHLLEERMQKAVLPNGTRYLKPEGISIEKESEQVWSAIRAGIEHLPKLAEIYPVGGAGDRLALVCNIEQEPLPAAQLQMGGRTLLHGLVRDVQAREYLYHKLIGEQVTIPIALMTSQEKRNHYRILKILEKWQSFHRPEESIRLFTQPLVPMVSEEGKWLMSKTLHPKLKPGGHGAVWKLALDQGIFDWFEEQGRSKGLIRQINNPIAGTDYGLLAFTGIGFQENKDFGFASCPRLPNTAEGTDVLVEEKTADGYLYKISNIEYTEFQHRGIEDRQESPDSPYSRYPSNTNILFFDFKAIRGAEKKCPIPGMLINMKNIVRHKGKDIRAGRLESTMQNIADAITLQSPAPLKKFDRIPSYITFNKRRKTLSVAKNAFSPERPLPGTPEGCLYEMMQNMEELFEQHCGIQLPELGDHENYLERGPGFFILIHPALGPLFSIIGQKIRGGTLAPDSDMILEIAELNMENLQLSGSLIVEADHVLGKLEENVLRYSADCGKCTLRNVTIENQGIDREAKNNIFWKNQLTRKEALEIRLQGNSEFFAENCTFKGNHHLVVPDGHRMVAYEEGGELKFHMDPIKKSWSWKYRFNKKNQIIIES